MNLSELLKSKGQTDDQVKGILSTLGPAQPIFEELLVNADRAQQDAVAKLAEAESKEKKLTDFWNNTATPQINDNFSKVAQAEAERDFYRRQAESAKAAGFIAKDAPGFDPSKTTTTTTTTADPRIVKNEVPGSPGLSPQVVVDMITTSSFLMGEHQRLFNEPLLNLKDIVEEAGRRNTKAQAVWEEKYKVPERRAAIAAEEQKKHDDAIREETRKTVTTELASRYGHEGTRPLVPSRFPNYAKDEKTGAPDKLAWTRADKRERLKQRIYEKVAKETGHAVQ